MLLVCLDTVRPDRTSLAGARDTTPALAALARSGTTFDLAFSPGNESLYAHAALFTGRWPSEVAVPTYTRFGVPDATPTLADALRRGGYRTAAFTGGGHVVASFGFDAGFDTFEAASEDFGSLFDSVPRALAWIGTADERPWFAFVHGYDAHTPWTAPGPFLHRWAEAPARPEVEQIAADPLAIERVRADVGGGAWFAERPLDDLTHVAGRRLLGLAAYEEPWTRRADEHVVPLAASDVAHLRDHYDGGVSYGDAWLAVLLAEVDLRSTVVVVVADHGEDLFDHGVANHRAGLWDSTTRVPMVAAGPGFPAGARVSAFTDLRDVAPTLLAAAGLSPLAGAAGVDLRHVASGELPGHTAVYAEGVLGMVSVRDREGRLTARVRLDDAADVASLADAPIDGGRFSLWDVPDTGDRLRTPDAAARARAESLRASLLAWRATLIPSDRGLDSAEGDARREQLRREGYSFEPGPGTAGP